MGLMLEAIGKAAMFEQLAEEAAELAQAALKLARIERGENPTPVSKEEAEENLREEYTDVYQCAMELEIPVVWEQIEVKRQRFRNRIFSRNSQKVKENCSSIPMAEPYKSMKTQEEK